MNSLRPSLDSGSDDSERRLRDLAQFARRLARQLIGEGADADDVAQEAVIAAWRGAPDDRDHARGWVAQTVRRGVFGRLRSGAARRARERESARSELAGEPADAALLLIEHQRRLLEALASLPAEMRVALSTRFLEGLSTQETAERLGIPRETVRSRTRRGLARLRECLIEEDGESRSELRSMGWLAVLAGTREPTPSSVLALSTAASTFATAITMKKILFAAVLFLIPLLVLVRPWESDDSALDPSGSEAVATAPAALGSVDKTSIVAPGAAPGRSALQELEVLPAGEPEAIAESVATVQFIGRDKVSGDNEAMDGELVFGSGGRQVPVVHGRSELTAELLEALRSGAATSRSDVSLTLNGRAAFLGESELGALNGLVLGQTASVIALLMSPVELRVLDAVTQEDLEKVSVVTDQGSGGRFIIPDPEFSFWISSTSRGYSGSSPLSIPPHRPLHRTWVSAKGYAPRLVNLDHSEAGREIVVELEPAGTLSVTISPSPARPEDFVLRFFDEEGKPSREQRLRYPLALATMLQGNDESKAGEPLTIELDPMPKGKWYVRLERGRYAVQGEVCAAGECEVVAGQRTRLALEPKKQLLAANGTLEGVVRYGGAHPPSGARLRARSLAGVISGDPLGKPLVFDGAGEAPFRWELPVGDWELFVTPQLHTFEVSVGPGVRSGVELDLPALATLTLVLVDKDTGGPIEAPAMLFTTKREYERSRRVYSGYPIPPVDGEPGAHRIELSPQDLLVFPNLPEYQTATIPVHLTAPSTELEVECERAATATVRLVSSVGAQLLPKDAKIRVLDVGSTALRRASKPHDTMIVLRVNEEGNYRIDIPVPIGFEKLEPVTLDFRKEALPTVEVTLVRKR